MNRTDSIRQPVVSDPIVSDQAILRTAVNWLEQSRPVALATVIGTWGSAPRPVGSLLVADDAGRFMGSVSGGCVEAAVIEAAQQLLARPGKPIMLEFRVGDDQAWSVGLACGGTIRVQIRALQGDDKVLPTLLDDIETRRPAAVLNRLDSGVQRLVHDDDGLDPELAAAVREALQQGRSRVLQTSAEAVFVQSFTPAWRLCVVGGVHIAQALIPMAQLAGYAVVLIDPRSTWVGGDRFGGVDIITEWPDRALERLRPDAYTALVTLSHDPKLDDPALLAALNAPTGYIGALGSRRTHTARLERLREAGLDDLQLQRIHAPIGLPLGGRSPAEIAVAILAEIVQLRYRSEAAVSQNASLGTPPSRP